MNSRTLVILVLGAAFILFVAGIVGFGIGHRRGKGRACFEVAIATRSADGSTLKEALLVKPGTRADYTYWGRDCTLTITLSDRTGMREGRWRYDVETATLFAEDESGHQLFPAAGRSPYILRR